MGISPPELAVERGKHGLVGGSVLRIWKGVRIAWGGLRSRPERCGGIGLDGGCLRTECDGAMPFWGTWSWSGRWQEWCSIGRGGGGGSGGGGHFGIRGAREEISNSSRARLSEIFHH